MRRSLSRPKDVINRSLKQEVTSPMSPLSGVGSYSRLEIANMHSVPMLRIQCTNIKQQLMSVCLSQYCNTSQPTSKFEGLRREPTIRKEPCQRVMRKWIWDMSSTKQQRRSELHFCQKIRGFASYNDGSRSKSKRQQNYELSGKRIIADPFVTLGIVRSPTLKFTSVKSTFLKIAMKYHPDTTAQCSDAERETNKDLFVSARKAFEAIVANPDGIAILKTEADDYVEEEEDFEEWFKSETGYDMPFMDAATMKEVAEMTESVGGGLDRDGGMWTLARMVANTVKAGGDSKSVLQLDAGIIRDRAIDGILRRRRRR